MGSVVLLWIIGLIIVYIFCKLTGKKMDKEEAEGCGTFIIYGSFILVLIICFFSTCT